MEKLALFDKWTEVVPLGDLLVRAAHLHGDRDALVLPQGRQTYRELLKGAVDVARGLSAQGVERGQHVGILMNNSFAFVHSLFGIALLGCVAVPLNVRHKATELAYIIDNADLVMLLTSTAATDYVDFGDVLAQALPSLAAGQPGQSALPEAKRLRAAVIVEGTGRPGFIGPEAFRRAAHSVDAARIAQARSRVGVRDTAAIIYTSGTTAHPKGCILPHEALTRGPIERARFRLAAPGRNVTWAAGPLFHIGSLSPFIGSVGVAGTFLSDTYFDAGRALDLMTQEGVTLAWPWFSAVVQALLDHPDFDAERLGSLRHLFMIATAPVVRRTQKMLPRTEINQGCGMTETAGIFALSDPSDSKETRATTQGKVAPGLEVSIRDPDTGQPVAPGSIGEILVRGYNVTSGYYKEPEKTAAALTPDGWLRTGDLYAQRDDGSVIFHGRLKDMLKVGAENVSALEVETFLAEHPAVRIAEVVGAPDPRLDEVPVAFIELRPGRQASESELIAFCRGRIASYKVPRAIRFVAPGAWPMSLTKVDKRALRSLLTASPEPDTPGKPPVARTS